MTEKISQKCINAIIKQKKSRMHKKKYCDANAALKNPISPFDQFEVLKLFTNKLQKQINIRFRHFLLMTLEVAASQTSPLLFLAFRCSVFSRLRTHFPQKTRKTAHTITKKCKPPIQSHLPLHFHVRHCPIIGCSGVVLLLRESGREGKFTQFLPFTTIAFFCFFCCNSPHLSEK